VLNKNERQIQSLYQATKAVFAIWYGFDFEKVSLLSPINLDSNLIIFSKEHILNLAKVEMAGNLSLQRVYKNIFNIGLEDRAKALMLIDEVVKNYTIISSESRAEVLQDIITEVEGTLLSLEKIIKELASILEERETLKYGEVKEKLNEIF